MVGYSKLLYGTVGSRIKPPETLSPVANWTSIHVHRTSPNTTPLPQGRPDIISRGHITCLGAVSRPPKAADFDVLPYNHSASRHPYFLPPTNHTNIDPFHHGDPTQPERLDEVDLAQRQEPVGPLALPLGLFPALRHCPWSADSQARKERQDSGDDRLVVQPLGHLPRSSPHRHPLRLQLVLRPQSTRRARVRPVHDLVPAERHPPDPGHPTVGPSLRLPGWRQARP
nr:hypothetical protein CFP56_50505 [Quercus suber]POF20064.1 hypothetical protein CFP56_52313 [Quercus suber]